MAHPRCNCRSNPISDMTRSCVWHDSCVPSMIKIVALDSCAMCLIESCPTRKYVCYEGVYGQRTSSHQHSTFEDLFRLCRVPRLTESCPTRWRHVPHRTMSRPIVRTAPPEDLYRLCHVPHWRSHVPHDEGMSHMSTSRPILSKRPQKTSSDCGMSHKTEACTTYDYVASHHYHSASRRFLRLSYVPDSTESCPTRWRHVPHMTTSRPILSRAPSEDLSRLCHVPRWRRHVPYDGFMSHIWLSRIMS